LEIGYIQTLLAVVKHRSFAAAARSLGLSRSAVSLQIAVIEETFDVHLFDRSTRPPQLTFERRAFLHRARELMATWALMSGREDATEASGTLVIGAVQTVVAGLLPYALRRFQQQCPDVRIRIITGVANELDAMLRRNDLDVIVQPHSDNILPGLVWQPVCREPLVVVAPEGLKGDTDTELLAAAPFVRFRRIAWGMSRMIDQEFVRRGIEVTTMGEVDSIDSVLTLVCNGLGVSILPQRMIEKPFCAGVRHVPFGDPPLARTIGVLWRGHQAEQTAIQVLYRSLLEITKDLRGDADVAEAPADTLAGPQSG